MNYVKLGRTDLDVSRLALGGLFVSQVGGPFEQARDATLRALELGVNYIDTAPGYANSEEVLGRILADVDRPVILSTKLGGRPQPFVPKSLSALRHSFEESLRLLGRERVDILMVHEPDRPRQYDWWDDLSAAEGPVWDLLVQLKDEGLIRWTGLGGTTAYTLPRVMRTGKFDVVLTAFNYSLLWREAGIEALPTAAELGMGVVIGSPLQQGALARMQREEVESGAPWLSTPRREQFKALYAYLDEIDTPIVEAALRFVISDERVHTVLMGARSGEEVEQNVRYVEAGPLEPKVLDRLDEIAAMVPFRPFEEPFGLPWNSEYPGPGHACR